MCSYLGGKGDEMKLGEKYNLSTAIAMVIGSVIGSGVFFKAETVARITHGNGKTGLLAWSVGGLSMMVCLLSFSIIASETKRCDGLQEIGEITAGEGYSYYLGWFMATVYYPALTSVLSWLSARYSLLALGTGESSGGLCMLLAGLFLIVSFAQNSLFPKLSGNVQKITTVIKLIPLILMIILGIRKGLLSGNLHTNMNPVYQSATGENTFFASVSAVMFAYEGWIAALSIGRELKNSTRNLPTALVLGGVSVLLVYIFYYLGIMGAASSETLLNYGSDGIKIAFSNILGKVSGLLLSFVAISCIGALNGMMFSLGRAVYSIAKNGQGPSPGLFSEVNPVSGMPIASFSLGLVFSVIWLFFLFGTQISEYALFGDFGFDISEIPVVTVYGMYIPLFFSFLKKWGRKISVLKRITVSMGIIACIFTAVCAIYAHFADITDYTLVFVAIMLAGTLFKKKAV